MSLLTWPACVSVASPPLPGAPALFEIAVKECRFFNPRRCIAEIRVSSSHNRQPRICTFFNRFILTSNTAKAKP